MKKRKIIIAVVSVVVITSLVAGLALTLNQIWNTIYDIQEELETKAVAHVIEGSFDIMEGGDLITSMEMGTGEPLPIAYYHYKIIEVTELTLSDMPSVQVFVKPYEISELGAEDLEQMWIEYPTNIGGSRQGLYYDEGCVYINYKMTNNYGGDIHY